MDPLINILHTRANSIFDSTSDADEIIPSVDAPLSDDTTMIDEQTNNTLGRSALITRLEHIEREVQSILNILKNNSTEDEKLNTSYKKPSITDTVTINYNGEKILEGYFNGEKMIGDDNNEYAVPPNYASKSKIVEGDRMKLTIQTNGRFIYKQIAPVERKRIVGKLIFDEDTQLWSVDVDGMLYKILTASATFYKGKSGDEVIILVHQDKPCGWGAVDNIIRT